MNRAGQPLHKILVLRFSSIGDIVLTSPVVRCLKHTQPSVQIHYLTKQPFAFLLEPNPYIDKVYSFQKLKSDILHQLKKENYDVIIDLHHNVRSLRVKMALGKKSYAVNKLNVKKFLLTAFKVDKLPKMHIVDRYMDVVKKLQVKYDGKGLDFFMPENFHFDLKKYFPCLGDKFVALVVGAGHTTKQFPAHKIAELIRQTEHHYVLLGGKQDVGIANDVVKLSERKVWNACGKLNLFESADVVKKAKLVLSNDTGLMHIAAALNQNIISVWGNTVPAFGMTPFYPDNTQRFSKIMEVKALRCRPCSKIGYDKCPQKHFNCMEQMDMNEMIITVNRFFTVDNTA